VGAVQFPCKPLWCFGAGAVVMAAICATMSAPAFAVPVTVTGADLSGKSAAMAECTLGDLVADSVCEQADAQCAVISASEIKSVSFPPGKLDSDQIVAALQHGADQTDTVVVLHLTGSQLLAAFERSVSRAPAAFDGYLQVAGIKVAFAPNAAHGARVKSVVIDGAAVNPASVYTVATSSVLADGALGYFVVWQQSDIVKDTRISLSNAVKAYLTKHNPINYTALGRIEAK